MVKYNKQNKCQLSDQIFALLTGGFDEQAVATLENNIKECVEKSGLTNEQLGNEFWRALNEANRFNRGDD